MQLTIEVNFISLKPGSDETRIMYTKSDNIEIMFGDDNDDIIEQLFESLLQKYEENLQNKMKGSEFEFDGNNLNVTMKLHLIFYTYPIILKK